MNVRPKEGGGLRMSCAAHFRHLEKVIEAYGKVLDGATELLSIEIELSPHDAENLERDVRAAC